MKFSIFGFNGFIGSNIVNYLKSKKIECNLVDPNDEEIFERSLGHVIYCIGVTGDFKKRPFDTVESHVCLLYKMLKNCEFDSFLYLSSTRVYSSSDSTNESEPILVNPNYSDNLYNISKMMGESLCLTLNSNNIRVVRLSNVVGKKTSNDDFLSSIIHEAVLNKKINLHTTPSSEKDYVYIDDVVKILEKIAIQGKERVYNVAYGKNIKVSEISAKIKKITNCEINFESDAVDYSFPVIDINRIKNEFDFNPSLFLEKLDELVMTQKNSQNV